MKYISLILLLLLIILSFGCNPPMKEGKVCSKHYEAQRVMLTFLYIYNGNTFTPVPYWLYDDEDYIITLCEENEDGRMIYRDLYVTEDIWNETELDSWFCITPDCEYSDPDIKEKCVENCVPESHE